jgi:hypothetical protein
MARWHDGTMARWRGGAVARWRGGAVARWRDFDTSTCVAMIEQCNRSAAHGVASVALE